MAYVSKINGYDIKDAEARQSVTDLQGDVTTEETARENADTALGNRITNESVKMIETTWAELKALRDDGELVKGTQYRITDYLTTTALADTRSAGHQFDIIMTADSKSVLNENARAAVHAGDTYFADSKLQTWKLKYCLDNDSSRFTWADTTNGKGVIYRLIDEKENDLPYDFKNIQFLRYKVSKYLVNSANWANSVNVLNSNISSVTSLRWGGITNGSAEEAIDDNSSTWYDTTATTVELSNSDNGWWKVDDEYDLFVLNSGESKYFYTFSQLADDTSETTDASLLGSVYKNKFGIYKSSNVLSLSNSVFIGTDFFFNTVGNGFQYNTVGNDFRYNTVGNYFQYNTVGNYYYYNHFEDGVLRLNFNVNGTSSSAIQKYRVLAGTAPTSAQTVAVTAGNIIPYNIKQTAANAIQIVAA